jgi:hypothetical protein
MPRIMFPTSLPCWKQLLNVSLWRPRIRDGEISARPHTATQWLPVNPLVKRSMVLFDSTPSCVLHRLRRIEASYPYPCCAAAPSSVCPLGIAAPPDNQDKWEVEDAVAYERPPSSGV